MEKNGQRHCFVPKRMRLRNGAIPTVMPNQSGMAMGMAVLYFINFQIMYVYKF